MFNIINDKKDELIAQTNKIQTLLSLMKTPLLICLSLNSWRIFLALGGMQLILWKEKSQYGGQHQANGNTIAIYKTNKIWQQQNYGKFKILPLNPHNEGKLGFARHSDSALGASSSAEEHFLGSLAPVENGILFGPLEGFGGTGTGEGTNLQGAMAS